MTIISIFTENGVIHGVKERSLNASIVKLIRQADEDVKGLEIREVDVNDLMSNEKQEVS